MNLKPALFFNSFFVLLICFSPTLAQSQVITVQPAAQKPQATPTATPTAPPAAIRPDQKAYDDARRISEPQKKIEALEKFVIDFPDSFMKSMARFDVLDTIIRNFPDQKDKIRAAAEKILAHGQGNITFRGMNYSNVASRLLSAGILLEWAEELAKKGNSTFEQDLAKELKTGRSRNLDTLGRIYLKQGKTKQARKLLKEALKLEPDLTTAMLGMAEIEASDGDQKAALELYTNAAVKAPLKKTDRQQMEQAYRVTHNDSLNGLEDLLDEKYKKLNAGINFAHFQPTPKRSNRTALAELFTGSGCGPCVAADLGFEGLIDRYKRQDLVVLIYHLHVPAPDPMTNPATVERGKYYAVPGTPTSVVDGFKLPSGGGPREMTRDFYDRINPKIEQRLESPAAAEVTVTATIEGNQLKSRVTVDKIKSPSPDLRLQLALTEDGLRYTGENGVRFHPMVVRSLGGKDASGFVVLGSGPTNVEWTFDLKALSDELKKYLDEYEQKGHRGDTFTFSEKKFQIDPQKLSVVAFVQDMKTKDVLQTAYLRVAPSSSASAQTPVK